MEGVFDIGPDDSKYPENFFVAKTNPVTMIPKVRACAGRLQVLIPEGDGSLQPFTPTPGRTSFLSSEGDVVAASLLLVFLRRMMLACLVCDKWMDVAILWYGIRKIEREKSIALKVFEQAN